MKKQTISVLLKISAIIFGIYSLSSCAEKDLSAEDFLPPTLSLSKAEIKTNSIVLACSFNVEEMTGYGFHKEGYGATTSQDFVFEYGTDPDFTHSSEVSAQLNDGYFSAEITHYIPSTKYYYRASVTKEHGRNTITTDEEVFTTLDMSPSVEIGGLTWATHNVEKEGYSIWYYTWDEAMSICPDGWSLPTKAEYEDLLNSVSTWVRSETNTTPGNSAGRWLGSNHKNAIASNPGMAIFFPASGYRNFSTGNLNLIDLYGSYWTSTSTGDNAFYLSFSGNNVRTEKNSKAFWRSVRCVEGYSNTPRVTMNVRDIKATTATFNGEVTFIGSAIITERGFLYSDMNANPAVGGSNVTKVMSNSDSGIGEFTNEITNLSATRYYARAYAISSENTFYSEVKTFTTVTSSADAPAYVDGSYEGVGVKVGDLWWAPINVGYGSDASYGLLFNWGKNAGFKYDAVGQSNSEGNWAEKAQGPCPNGWYVPSKAQYDNLLLVTNSPVGTTDLYPGQWRNSNEDTPEDVAGRWFGPNCRTAIADTPGQAIFFPATGYWYPIFSSRGSIGYYWSSTSGKTTSNTMYFDRGNARMSTNRLDYGISVRCIHD